MRHVTGCRDVNGHLTLTVREQEAIGALMAQQEFGLRLPLKHLMPGPFPVTLVPAPLLSKNRHTSRIWQLRLRSFR